MSLQQTLQAQMKAAISAMRSRANHTKPDIQAILRQAMQAMPANLRGAMPDVADVPAASTAKNFVPPQGADMAANMASKLPDFVSDLLAHLGVGAQGHARAHTQDGGAAEFVKNFCPQHFHPQPGSSEAENPLNAPGQFLARSFTNHAGTRAYKVYIPTSYRGQALPLMVMLHGCTQHPDDFAQGTRMNEVAEEQQCFVVYPAQTQGANASKCWNWFKAVDQQRDEGEPSIIAGITREVLAEYGLDAGKVYVAGLSAGGAMAIILGNTYPDLYAAVGVHSGLPYASAHDVPSAFAAMQGGQGGLGGLLGSMPSPLRKKAEQTAKKGSAQARLQAIPIIVFHGDNDTTVNASNGEKLIADSVPERIIDKQNPTRSVAPDVIVEEGKVPHGRRYTRTSHHAPEGRALAEHWLIHGAGHAWAGGSANGSYTDAAGPDASREMLRFFYTQQQDKNVSY